MILRTYLSSLPTGPLSGPLNVLVPIHGEPIVRIRSANRGASASFLGLDGHLRYTRAPFWVGKAGILLSETHGYCKHCQNKSGY